MPYRNDDSPPDDPVALYAKAHALHYKQKDEVAAKELYLLVIERFESSPEAGYARSQLKNIDKAKAPVIPTATPRELTTEEKIAKNYSCRDCNHKECSMKKVSMAGSGLTRVLDLQKNFYLALACEQCGATRFYDLNILEGRGGFKDSVIDLMFG